MDRPLRILQVAAFPFPSPQGSQVYVRGMVRALARRGHTVTVVCYAHGQGAMDPGYAVVRAPPLVPGYHNLRSGPDWVKPVLDVALLARLRRLEADIVHAHNYEAPLIAAISRLWTGIPVVYNAHTTMEEELPTYFSGRLAAQLARGAGHVLDRTVPRLSAHAIAINPTNVGFLREVGCRAVTHIAPGVDPDDLIPEPAAVLPPGPWVLYAGNPDRYQDLDVLVAAMRRVPEAGLLLVSASPLGALERCGLTRLRCVVTADYREVRALMAASTVAALPRSVCSGFPIKLLNYLGMGLPTVAAEGSAHPLPGVVAVPNRDPAAMAVALRSLLEDVARRQALARAARAHILSAWTWDARVTAVEGVYRAVLSGARRGIVRASAAAIWGRRR